MGHFSFYITFKIAAREKSFAIIMILVFMVRSNKIYVKIKLNLGKDKI